VLVVVPVDVWVTRKPGIPIGWFVCGIVVALFPFLLPFAFALLLLAFAFFVLVHTGLLLPEKASPPPLPAVLGRCSLPSARGGSRSGRVCLPPRRVREKRMSEQQRFADLETELALVAEGQGRSNAEPFVDFKSVQVGAGPDDLAPPNR
jgi:hypothetical protein